MRRGVLVSRGYTRICVIIGPLVFKVPNVFRGWRYLVFGLIWNMHEKHLVKESPHKLCPLYFSLPGGFLNVMARAVPLTKEEFSVFDASVFLKDLNVNMEAKFDSFGRLANGQVVCLDFSPYWDFA